LGAWRARLQRPERGCCLHPGRLALHGHASADAFCQLACVPHPFESSPACNPGGACRTLETEVLALRSEQQSPAAAAVAGAALKAAERERAAMQDEAVRLAAELTKLRQQVRRGSSVMVVAPVHGQMGGSCVTQAPLNQCQCWICCRVWRGGTCVCAGAGRTAGGSQG
jgi:hypothetical protein